MPTSKHRRKLDILPKGFRPIVDEADLEDTEGLAFRVVQGRATLGEGAQFLRDQRAVFEEILDGNAFYPKRTARSALALVNAQIARLCELLP